ncbi:hypothetical protein U1Q18_008962 [Sarracenia purpurea var. burkii]
MLGMGMTLTFDDLRGAFATPTELIIGFVLQYSVMPLSGYYVSMLLSLPSYYDVGLILVAYCPGVHATGLLISTLQAVLLPVLGGALLNNYFQSQVKFVSPLMPPIAVETVAVLCGNAIAQRASAILTFS